MAKPDWEWQDDAACRGEDLVLFFGPDNERQPEKGIRERKAKAICAQCPVRTDCLLYALAVPEKYGTWGGLNEDERASERRRRMRRGVPLTPAPAVPESKRCGNCHVSKAADEFNRNAKRYDGLAGWCRECVNRSRRATWARAGKQGVA